MTEENLFVQEEEEPKEINFATVAEIYDDGISLIFDGEEAASEKHYKCNSFVVFSKGDRVRIAADSGTYIVEYPIGNPRKTLEADYAKKAKTAENADNASKLNNKTESQLSVNNAAKLNNKTEANLSVSKATTATNFTGRHTGSGIAFFNSAAVAKKAVATTGTSNPTTTALASTLNALINALKGYGLIN